jgi:hypothetical protein
MSGRTNNLPARLTIGQWDDRYAELVRAGLREPSYGGPLRRHADDGDHRLLRLSFDNSPAALRLWNFLLTEEDRLHAARAAGMRIVGAMKDLGTVPVMATSLPGLVAFYPDGAWWTPCVMEMSDELLAVADRLGIDETFCPVRAMLGAFVTRRHFPIPDLLVCSAGAVCDDFSAIAQRLNGLGHPILWWEVPPRRDPEPDEAVVPLPGGGRAGRDLIAFLEGELRRVGEALGRLAGVALDEARLAAGIRRANGVRRRLRALRETVFTAAAAPLPALELLIAEMLAIHFCSDLAGSEAVLDDLLAEVRRRASAGLGVTAPDAVRVFWVNPVADLRMMNRLETAGGRLCGTDFLFSHALDDLPEDVPPFEALARAAAADPMAGPARDRAARIARDAAALGAEALVVSRIPGASHCATEGRIIAEAVRATAGIPCVELEVPPLSDALDAALSTRIGALIETARARRGSAE